jgi:hypothetical protein
MYEKHEIIRSLPVYANHLAENEWKNPMMVRTYIGPQRCWEGFQPAEVNRAEREEIEKRVAQKHEENKRRKAHADQMWKERYAKLVGHEPTGV